MHLYKRYTANHPLRIFLYTAAIFVMLSPISSNRVSALNNKVEMENKTKITADRMDAYKKQNMVKFYGNVVVTQKEFTLYSKELLIYYSNAQDIKEIIALGDVKITQPNRIATGDKAVYKSLTKTLIITGNPMIKQGRDTVTGKRVIFYLDEDKSIVEGGERKRVNAVIYPQKSDGDIE